VTENSAIAATFVAIQTAKQTIVINFLALPTVTFALTTATLALVTAEPAIAATFVAIQTAK